MFQPLANDTCNLKVWDSESVINTGHVLTFYVIVALKCIFPNWFSVMSLTRIIRGTWKCSRVIAILNEIFTTMLLFFSLIFENIIILVVVRCVCDSRIRISQNQDSCF